MRAKRSIITVLLSGVAVFLLMGQQDCINPPTPTTPVLSVSQSSLDFGTTATQRTFTVSNTGVGTLSWTITSGAAWLSCIPDSGGNGPTTVTATIQRNQLSAGNNSSTLTVNSNGGTATIQVSATVDAVGPTAQFNAAPRQGQAPLPVSFTDLSSSGGQPITARLWNFGDGATSPDADPLHTYTNPGQYTVSLTVTTSAGQHTETKTNYILVTDRTWETRHNVVPGTFQCPTDCKPTSDGGFIAVGFYYDPNWNINAFARKVNKDGAVQWTQTFVALAGRSPVLMAVVEDPSGGYVATGAIEDGWGNHQTLLLKMYASNGAVEWSKIDDLPPDDPWPIQTDWFFSFGSDVIVDRDGTYVVTGACLTPTGQSEDLFIMTVDRETATAKPVQRWRKTYHDSVKSDLGTHILQIAAGDYVAIGYIHTGSDYDIRAVRVNPNGVEQASNSIGGTRDQLPFGVVEAGDGSLYVGGFNGDFWAWPPDAQVYLAKVNYQTLGLQWAQNYGSEVVLPFGLFSDVKCPGGIAIDQAGHVIMGCSVQVSEDGAGNVDFDQYLVKVNTATQGVIWDRTRGTPDIETCLALRLSQTGGLIIAGQYAAFGQFGIGLTPEVEVLLTRTDADGNVAAKSMLEMLLKLLEWER